MLALPYTYIIEYTEFKGMVYSMEPTVLFGRAFQSRTHSQRESTSNFTGITVDWNIARSLYSINLYELEVTAFSSGYFLGNANWMIDCGGEKSIITQYLWTIIELRGIPFYAVSPIAEESLKYSNICGKWAGSSLQEKYQEPCVVFVGRPSLRSSAAINFIREWEIIQIIQRYLQTNFLTMQNFEDPIINSTSFTNTSFIPQLDTTLNVSSYVNDARDIPVAFDNHMSQVSTMIPPLTTPRTRIKLTIFKQWLQIMLYYLCNIINKYLIHLH
ncbi:hypothetical protein RhiirB3_525538 [Rhizophagus irregularis]|nr:hypothetical protein RhiirB3_525538 [Rhizophagus irregularis]